MKTISSKDNPVLKSARKLCTRKGRNEAGAFLVEGRKLIKEAITAGLLVENVFIDAGALARGEAVAGEYASEIALDERLFRDLSETVTPQPYIAAVSMPEAGRNEFNRELLAREDSTAIRILILDRIGDPGNVGTMIRSALAAGMDCVWCVKGTTDVFSDKAVRASAGAVFHIPVWEGMSVQECVSNARAMDVKILVCSAGGKDLYEAELNSSFALVIGNEGSGPQEGFTGAADTIVGIPMAAGAESLNAATAAAIVMYEALRQTGVEK